MIRTSSLIVFACKSKACAPPPVGTGGSNPSSRASDLEKYTPPPGVSSDPGYVELHYSGRLATKHWIANSNNASDFTDPQTAIGNYISVAYTEINDTLRGHLVLDESNTAIVKDLIKGMDKAFDMFGVPLRSQTVMYRGLDMEMKPDEVRSLFAKGSTFTDKGYTSTSLSEHTARTFYGATYSRWDSTQVLVRITAPKGTTVLAGSSPEYELILNRGTRFKVTSTKDEVDEYGDKTGRLLVNMQVLRGTMSK